MPVMVAEWTADCGRGQLGFIKTGSRSAFATPSTPGRPLCARLLRFASAAHCPLLERCSNGAHARVRAYITAAMVIPHRTAGPVPSLRIQRPPSKSHRDVRTRHSAHHSPPPLTCGPLRIRIRPRCGPSAHKHAHDARGMTCTPPPTDRRCRTIYNCLLDQSPWVCACVPDDNLVI